jgi:hypothetical protein
MTDTTKTAKRPKGRSPSYPALNLETAIGRARQLYDQERQHPASVNTIMRHWGYRSMNGPASLSLAALKKFGLIEDEGTGSSRTAKVTDLAVEILEHPSEAIRREAIKRAALNPRIHRELWDQYGANPPSDTNLRWTLTRDRGFTETGADEFIPEYRATIAFAQLSSSDTVEPQDQEPTEDGDADEDETPQQSRRRRVRRVTPAAGGTLTYAVPVAPGLDVAIEGPFPLSEEQWKQFIVVLEALKPGLVGEKLGDDRYPADDEENGW